jgi:hypothetical protein
VSPVVHLAQDQKTKEKEREIEATIQIEGVPPGIGVKVSPEHVKLAPIKPQTPPP